MSGARLDFFDVDHTITRHATADTSNSGEPAAMTSSPGGASRRGGSSWKT